MIMAMKMIVDRDDAPLMKAIVDAGFVVEDRPGELYEYAMSIGRFKVARWLSEQRMTIDEMTEVKGNMDLSEYQFPLPTSLIYCTGNLILSGYEHELHDNFVGCGGDLVLDYYDHKLNEGFVGCGGNLYINHYYHELPKSFRRCGWMT